MFRFCFCFKACSKLIHYLLFHQQSKLNFIQNSHENCPNIYRFFTNSMPNKMIFINKQTSYFQIFYYNLKNCRSKTFDLMETKKNIELQYSRLNPLFVRTLVNIVRRLNLDYSPNIGEHSPNIKLLCNIPLQGFFKKCFNGNVFKPQ